MFVAWVKVLALTDHDTMAGIREAVSADSKFGIRIIPGVEMSIIQGKCLLAFSYVARIRGYGYRYAIRGYSDMPFFQK